MLTGFLKEGLAAVLAALGGGSTATVAFGSKATSTSAAAIGTGTAPGGLVLTNADGTIVIWVGGLDVAATPGVGKYPLRPGASIVIPNGDLAAIGAVSESGTPTLAWVRATPA
jgi:hypothetical protein